jgi:hypothetical protein
MPNEPFVKKKSLTSQYSAIIQFCFAASCRCGESVTVPKFFKNSVAGKTPGMFRELLVDASSYITGTNNYLPPSSR